MDNRRISGTKVTRVSDSIFGTTEYYEIVRQVHNDGIALFIERFPGVKIGEILTREYYDYSNECYNIQCVVKEWLFSD